MFRTKSLACPTRPSFSKASINWRGEVLPVIDQRKRFGLPTEEPGWSAAGRRPDRPPPRRADRRRVSEVLRTSPGAIEPAPELIAGTNSLVNGVVNLPDRGQMILLLEAERVERSGARAARGAPAIADQASL